MNMEQILKDFESACHQVLNKFHEELQSVRGNRPSVQLVENIVVECYGQSMPVKQVGSLSVRPPRDIEINVWDKGVIGSVVKAIQESNVGLSVSNDGNVIRATLPALTTERREEFSKLVKKMSEQTRIQLRAKRDDANKHLKTAEENGEISEDQVFKGKEKIQSVTDIFNKEIETALDKKVAELSE